MGPIHNDIYNTDELTHKFEYGLFEDIVKSKQLMADLKQNDEYKKTLKEQMNQEFDNFPMEDFKEARVVSNENDPELKSAADAVLFNIEQVLQQQQPKKHAPPASHMHKDQHNKHSTQDE